MAGKVRDETTKRLPFHAASRATNDETFEKANSASTCSSQTSAKPRRFRAANDFFETSLSAIQDEVVGARARNQIAKAKWGQHSPFQALIGIEKLFSPRDSNARRSTKRSRR